MLDANIFVGERVRLTGVSHDDLPTMAGWYEDAGFLRLMDAVVARPKTAADLKEWLDQANKSNNGYLLGIRPVGDDELLGFVELDGILWNQQTAFLGIAIGARAHWDQGYGTEAMELALRFAFDELNLHRVSLTVFSYNLRAIALYEKLGFQREGIQRETLHRDGQRYDLVWYGLLRREWEARQL